MKNRIFNSVKKLIRITTIPLSLEKLLENQGQYFKAFYDITFISSNPEQLKQTAEKQGVSYFPLEMTRKISPLQDLRCLIQLYHFLRKRKNH